MFAQVSVCGTKAVKHSSHSAVASESSEVMIMVINQPGSSGCFKVSPFLVVFVLTVVLFKKQ